MRAASLVGKVMVITGASSGIGAATAIEAGRAGMRVVLAARRVGRLEGVAEEVRKAGGEALVVPTDVTRPEDVRAMIDAAVDAFGRVDVLFANAGFGYFGRALTNPAIEQRMWETNYFATERCIREALPVMRQQGGGHILVCSSIVGRTGLPYYAAYSATKAAQHALVRSLHLELEPEHIFVSGVYPSGTRTEWSQAVARISGRDAISENTPDLFMQSAQQVARKVIACVRMPRVEVWPSRFGHLAAAAWTLWPRLWRACFGFHTRWARQTMTPPAPAQPYRSVTTTIR